MKHTILMAKPFQGKIWHASLSHQTRWAGVTSVLNPSVLYPLMTTLYTQPQITKLNSIISTLQCHALSLNRNFPWALLHGPLILSGIGIPSPEQQNTSTRLNYFLCHIRHQSITTSKLDLAVLYTQMESGLLEPFFGQPFSLYGHITTSTFCARIWQETEPNGLQLHPSHGTISTPSKCGPHDISFTSLWQKGSKMISRCCLNLQITTLFDIMLYDGTNIHPKYIHGIRPLSRSFILWWPDHPTLPKQYRKLWSSFLHSHILPYIYTNQIHWDRTVKPNYKMTFYKSHTSHHLLSFTVQDRTKFHLLASWRRRSTVLYVFTP
jgi:hypothetical protein